jgi:hypothetical protein
VDITTAIDPGILQQTPAQTHRLRLPILMNEYSADIINPTRLWNPYYTIPSTTHYLGFKCVGDGNSGAPKNKFMGSLWAERCLQGHWHCSPVF